MSEPPRDAPAPPPQPLLVEPLAREASDRRRAVRVGVVALIAVALFIAGLLATGPLTVLRGPRVRVDFAFCGPIKPGASVRLAGVVIGVVERVELLAGRDAEAGPDAMVRVHARVQDDAAHLLTEQTRFYVTTLGVLGEHYLDVAPGQAGRGDGRPSRPLGDGARVDGITLARADLLLPRASALLERADGLLLDTPALQQLLSTTTSLLTSLDGLLRDDQRRAALAGDVDDVRALVGDLRTVLRAAAAGLGDGRALKASLEALPPVLDKAGRVEDALLQSDLAAFVGDARALLADSRPLVAGLAAGPAADAARQRVALDELQRTLRSLDAAAGRADRLLGVVEAKKGAAGRLFFDEAVADDLAGVLRELRKNPMDFLLR
jgi:ABC-type transporter Mla subunit MlaD